MVNKWNDKMKRDQNILLPFTSYMNAIFNSGSREGGQLSSLKDIWGDDDVEEKIFIVLKWVIDLFNTNWGF